MSFQFNFSIHESENSNNDSSEKPEDQERTNDQAAEEKTKMVAKEVKSTISSSIPASNIEELELCPGVTLRCIRSQSIEARLGSSNSDSCIAWSTKNHSDLIPNIYEGGLKVWECTFDLVGYLSESRVPLVGLSVLELGCGAGLPGIYALNQGAAHVCFQDFNEEVVKQLTVPNVCLNTGNDKLLQCCKFVSGDWSQIGEDLIPSHRYDVILTSETIYSTDSVPSLHKLIQITLKPEGTVYVAAKTHYFGVGGGTRLFEDYVRSQGYFSIHTGKKFTEGLQREILIMQRRKNSDR